jgi:tetratricopeptide (TPR) repeat protein
LLAKAVQSFCPRKTSEARAKHQIKNRADRRTEQEETQNISSLVDLNFFEKRFQSYLNDSDVKTGIKQTINVSNEEEIQKAPNENINLHKQATKSTKDVDVEIETILSDLSDMVGELEFQAGVQNLLSGRYADAADHFKMSANANNASAIFNLALLYEQGLGVKKNLHTALKLYELAGTMGHDKALFNMGVYSSQGLGGAKKSFRTAKKYFEKAANLGNTDAIEALTLLLPKRDLSDDPIDFISEDEKSPRVSVSDSILYYKHKGLQSVAVG